MDQTQSTPCLGVECGVEFLGVNPSLQGRASLIFRSMKTNVLLRFVSFVLYSVFGPSKTHTTVSVFLSGSRSNNVRGKPFKITMVSAQKAFQDKLSCWKERKIKVFPVRGLIDLPSRQISGFVPHLATLICNSLRSS